MLNIVKPDNEEHWLAMRALNINSTESAALFDMSPYLSMFELYHEKKNPVLVEFQDNERMEIGRDMEAAIAKHALKKLGARGRANKDYYYDDDSKMGSSYDWFISVSREYKNWNLEVKNVDFGVFRDNWDPIGDEMPGHIEVQVQHQMHLNRAPGCVVAAMVGGNKLYLFFRKYNPEMGEAIEEAVRDMWRRIQEEDEPEPCYYHDSAMLIKLNSAAGDQVYNADEDPEMQRLVLEMKEINTVCAEMEKVKDAKKAELLEKIGDQFNKIVFEGATVSCGRTEDKPDVTITKEMAKATIGTVQKGRKGYRMLRITIKKSKEEKVND